MRELQEPQALAGRFTADEVPDDPIELVRLLHEHEVIAALVLLEDLDPRPLDLFLDPYLRLPGHDARPAPDHERGQRDAWDHRAPVLRRVESATG
jgi:hypothetical protein